MQALVASDDLVAADRFSRIVSMVNFDPISIFRK